jgi:c-di-GMP-binding flagellar brake protein YcgR
MEKRREKRFLEKNEVLIKSAINGKETTGSVGANAYTFDLSLAGARIRSEQFFDIGTIIRININLERTGQSIKVDGEVKWFRKNEEDEIYELGVEFLHSISQTLLSLIRHLYSDRAAGIPSMVT